MMMMMIYNYNVALTMPSINTILMFYVCIYDDYYYTENSKHTHTHISVYNGYLDFKILLKCVLTLLIY